MLCPLQFKAIEFKPENISRDVNRKWKYSWLGGGVSRRILTAKFRVQSQDRPCGICSDQRGTGTGFQRVLQFETVSIIPLNFYIYSFIHLSQTTQNIF